MFVASQCDLNHSEGAFHRPLYVSKCGYNRGCSLSLVSQLGGEYP